METQGVDMVIQPGLANMASSETATTGNSTLDELARGLSGLVLKAADNKKVDEPPVFSGDWTESSALWVERYEKYTKFSKKEQTDEDKVDFAKVYLGGDALEWHSGASLLYRDWNSFSAAFKKKFDESKSSSEARKHISGIDIYKGKIIVKYGKLKRLFEIAGISEEEEQYDLFLEKLNHKDYDKMYDLTSKTAVGIMEYLLAEEEKWSSRKEASRAPRPVTAAKLAFPRAKQKETPVKDFRRATKVADVSQEISAVSMNNPQVSPLQCWRCGKIGHRKAECRNKPFWKTDSPRSNFYTPVRKSHYGSDNMNMDVDSIEKKSPQSLSPMSRAYKISQTSPPPKQTYSSDSSPLNFIQHSHSISGKEKAVAITGKLKCSIKKVCGENRSQN
ncbi:hypothetical protein AYI70_g4304 [Smittium culicis]|uniref:CCHC-type domain-containing protein n=1 Tax=Smittium culicis TaxID=133412 RepID=A0A1R1XZM8_9FUNG|nr:hypothetical protein AYI70_g4304 [Smittium culicis]